MVRLGRLAIGIAAAAAISVAIVIVGRIDLGMSTDCYADFPRASERDAAAAVAQSRGIEATALGRRNPGIRFHTGETGDDAASFRATVKQLVHGHAGHLEKNTPCLERPYFN